MYADDVVLFVKPLDDDLVCTKLILDCFGEASGLFANMNKSCATPICCAAPVVHECCSTLQCVPAAFPCTYLGLPISNKKLRTSDLIVWVDKIAARLPNWKASLLNLAGRTTLVRFVLSAIPVYLLIAMSVPKWVIKAIDKIRRAFLWKGRKEINGGCCLVAWEKVTRLLHLGGLGLPNLLYRSWALQARWLWLQKTDPTRSWIGLDIPVQPQVKALVSVISHVGNGNDTLFWIDRWLSGNSIKDLAPMVFSKVDKKLTSTRTVAQPLINGQWIRAIKLPLTLDGMQQYLLLWDSISEVVLSPETDQHVWRHESSGHFTSKSCYNVLFSSSITFEPWKRLWKSCPPPNVKPSYGWP
jgi:hypothetical protein